MGGGEGGSDCNHLPVYHRHTSAEEDNVPVHLVISTADPARRCERRCQAARGIRSDLSASCLGLICSFCSRRRPLSLLGAAPSSLCAQCPSETISAERCFICFGVEATQCKGNLIMSKTPEEIVQCVERLFSDNPGIQRTTHCIWLCLHALDHLVVTTNASTSKQHFMLKLNTT